MAKSFFLGNDATLATGAANFNTRITATPTVFGLTAAQATAYAAVNTAYQTAYTAAINPATRTRGAIATKDDARKNLRTMSSDYAKIVDAQPTVSNQQRIDLGLAPRSQRTPKPVPTAVPALEVLKVTQNVVDIRVRQTDLSKKGKPAGVLGAKIYSFVGETPSGNINDWKYEGSTIRTKVAVVVLGFESGASAGVGCPGRGR